MTLVLTEISKFGISMAADSAVTFQKNMPDGRKIMRVLTGVRKLQPIDKLQAGISVWGEGSISGVDSDVWLDQFIRARSNHYNSLETFARLLQDELRGLIPEIDVERYPEGTIGFHLAGYVDHRGKRTPTFYHIHNGRSKVLENRGIQIDPTKVNSNHDLPPEKVCEFLERGLICVVHNGDYYLYRETFKLLRTFLEDFAEKTRGRMLIPFSTSLKDDVEWARFEIETMANLYKFSGRPYPSNS